MRLYIFSIGTQLVVFFLIDHCSFFFVSSGFVVILGVSLPYGAYLTYCFIFLGVSFSS